MSDNLQDGVETPRRSIASSNASVSPTRSSPARRSGPSWADLSEVLETLGDQDALPTVVAADEEEEPPRHEVVEYPERTPSEGSLEFGTLPEATPSEGPSEVEAYHGALPESFPRVPSAPTSPSRLSPHAQEFTPGTEFSPLPASPSAPRLALLSTTPIAKPSPTLSANAPPFQPGAPAATLSGDVSTHQVPPAAPTMVPQFPSLGINGVWTQGPPASSQQVQGHIQSPGSVAPMLPGASLAPRIAAPLQPAPGVMELEALATGPTVGTGTSASSRPPRDGNRSSVKAGAASKVVDPRTLRPPPYSANPQQAPSPYTRPPPGYHPGRGKAVDSEAQNEIQNGYRGLGGSLGFNKKDRRQDRQHQEGGERWAPRSGIATSASEASADTSWGRSDNEASSNTTARDRASAHRSSDAGWWEESEWWDETSTNWSGRADDWQSRRPAPRQNPSRWDSEETWKNESQAKAPNVETHRRRFGRRSEDTQEPQETQESQPQEAQESRCPQRGWAGVNTAAFRRLAEGHLLGRGTR